MIELGKRFTAHRDKYQWILTEKYEGKDRKGNPKEQHRETYHGTLKQVCDRVVDMEAGDCNDVVELRALLEGAALVMARQVDA